MHVEVHESKETRYLNMDGFPLKWVRQGLLNETTCAHCGKGEEGTGCKLKACTACKMVKYCNRDCQAAHRSRHKPLCKARAAELQGTHATDDIDIIHDFVGRGANIWNFMYRGQYNWVHKVALSMQ